jgi:hypothetical protein
MNVLGVKWSYLSHGDLGGGPLTKRRSPPPSGHHGELDNVKYSMSELIRKYTRPYSHFAFSSKGISTSRPFLASNSLALCRGHFDCSSMSKNGNGRGGDFESNDNLKKTPSALRILPCKISTWLQGRRIGKPRFKGTSRKIMSASISFLVLNDSRHLILSDRRGFVEC